MAWIARDSSLMIFTDKPVIEVFFWQNNGVAIGNFADDLDEKLIGRHLTWEDEPVEI